MRKILVLLLIPLLYLLFWPVPIAPKAWEAPPDAGFSGSFAPNNALTEAEAVPLPEGYSGPEAVLIRGDGSLVISTHEGAVLQRAMGAEQFTVLVETGGRPLGLAETDNGELLIADAYLGLLLFDSQNRLQVLVDKVEGEPLGYVNSVAYQPGGWIYFTDSSAKFHARPAGGTYPASLLDIMEHGGHGRLFVYDMQTQALVEVAHGFNFANGVAVVAGDVEGKATVFVNETGNYRVLAFDLLDGVVQSQRSLIENLPGFPDNLTLAPDGGLWFGLVSPRSPLLDALDDKPWLRKLVQRLPAVIRPKAQHYGAIVKVSQTGEILHQLQDPEGQIYTTTGAAESDTFLYISRLHGDFLARVPLP